MVGWYGKWTPWNPKILHGQGMVRIRSCDLVRFSCRWISCDASCSACSRRSAWSNSASAMGIPLVSSLTQARIHMGRGNSPVDGLASGPSFRQVAIFGVAEMSGGSLLLRSRLSRPDTGGSNILQSEGLADPNSYNVFHAVQERNRIQQWTNRATCTRLSAMTNSTSPTLPNKASQKIVWWCLVNYPWQLKSCLLKH